MLHLKSPKSPVLANRMHKKEVINWKCVWEFGQGLVNLYEVNAIKTGWLTACILVVSTEKTPTRTPKIHMYL